MDAHVTAQGSPIATVNSHTGRPCGFPASDALAIDGEGAPASSPADASV
ncbi:hypothetical protein [Streptomyces sp. NPDC046978]